MPLSFPNGNYRLSRLEYEAAVETGAFRADAQLELLAGELHVRAAESRQHDIAIEMEADREMLCGPKGRDHVERPAWRGGSVDSQVTLGGRQVDLPRLRVRSTDGEVPLASFQWAAATDPLDEHTLAAVGAGVSTRRYASTLDPVPSEVTERTTSSSAVSRRFVALSTKRLQAFLDRPLGELDLRVVCIDGKVFRDHCMVIALGIDTQGRVRGWRAPRCQRTEARLYVLRRDLGGLHSAPAVEPGPQRKGAIPKPMMYGMKKSDEAVLPLKAANKGAQTPAESLEGRASTKGICETKARPGRRVGTACPRRLSGYGKLQRENRRRN